MAEVMKVHLGIVEVQEGDIQGSAFAKNGRHKKFSIRIMGKEIIHSWRCEPKIERMIAELGEDVFRDMIKDHRQ